MRLSILLGIASYFTCFVFLSATAADVFRAGAATSNITPPLGDEIIGAFVPTRSTHVHDELHARCLVLDDGKTRLALVVCDLLGIDRLVSAEARRLIAEQTMIPTESVLVSSTHTHSATSALGKGNPDPKLDNYQNFVARRIADGVARAAKDLRPAEIAFGAVDVPEHLFNRRWNMRPGTIPENPFGGADLVQMNPPAGSPNLLGPAGPTDPTISIFALREPSGAPISVFATYSLHYVGGIGPDHISADYYGYFCRHLEKLLGDTEQFPPFVAMMANGTSGDVNNINFLNPGPAKKPYEHMRFVAVDVADRVHSAVMKLDYRSYVSLASSYREPVLAWRRPNAEEREWATQTIAEGQQNRHGLAVIYAERMLKLAEYPKTTTVPVQVLRIGDVCIGTMPCEVFCEIGLEFKRRCPLQPSFMISLNHGYFGYLPPPRQLDLGGYETWMGTNILEREASNKLLTNLLQMAEELKTSTPAVSAQP